MKIGIERLIEVESGEARLEGMLAVPENATGIVLFAHGSGSGRFSPRNQFVASSLREMGLGTLLIDLLEAWEGEDRHKVFNIDLITQRLISAIEWLEEDEKTAYLPIGLFGASTGAAAALQAAALHKGIGAVVSRGGRPDLANYLDEVDAPTLFIVGGNDWPVIPLNQQAFEVLNCTKEMKIIPGATHLFEEPGSLEEVARFAGEWFQKYLH